MKPYYDYGVKMKETLRMMYKRHPQPTRVYYGCRDRYEALERDGWVTPIGKGSAALTCKGVAYMREIMS